MGISDCMENGRHSKETQASNYRRAHLHFAGVISDWFVPILPICNVPHVHIVCTAGSRLLELWSLGVIQTALHNNKNGGTKCAAMSFVKWAEPFLSALFN